MNFRRFLGLDIAAEKYAFAKDAAIGHISAGKVADTWVKTTCGYCSVGCGMMLGIRDGRAVTARGNPEHPVNRGKLCPKGLAEHYVLTAENRAVHPLMRRNGSLSRVSWDEAMRTMTGEFRRVAQQYGPHAVGVISTGQLVTEEFYTLGKLV
ncbi:MAG TPA: molybdopterin-dependent oxidoreductase, partial [Acidobacteriaceae bacterium]